MGRQYGVENCFRMVITQGEVSDIYQRIMMFTLFSHCLGIRFTSDWRKTKLFRARLTSICRKSWQYVSMLLLQIDERRRDCISCKMFISNTKTHDFGQSWVFLSLFYWIYRSPTRSFDMTLVGILNSVTPIYPGATSYSSNEMTSL